MARQSNLVSAPIATTLLAFALPTLASSVLQSANGSIDTVWVGRLIGEDAVAATTNGNLVMFLMTAFVFGFGMAATILVGQSFGRGDLDAARRVVGTHARGEGGRGEGGEGQQGDPQHSGCDAGHDAGHGTTGRDATGHGFLGSLSVYLGRLAPYFERPCLRDDTPVVSRVPRMMW